MLAAGGAQAGTLAAGGAQAGTFAGRDPAVEFVQPAM